MTLWNGCSGAGKDCKMQKSEELTQFLKALDGNKKKMSRQQYRTIKGQAMHGDVMDARKGMEKVMRRGSVH